MFMYCSTVEFYLVSFISIIAPPTVYPVGSYETPVIHQVKAVFPLTEFPYRSSYEYLVLLLWIGGAYRYIIGAN